MSGYRQPAHSIEERLSAVERRLEKVEARRRPLINLKYLPWGWVTFWLGVVTALGGIIWGIHNIHANHVADIEAEIQLCRTACEHGPGMPRQRGGWSDNGYKPCICSDGKKVAIFPDADLTSYELRTLVRYNPP